MKKYLMTWACGEAGPSEDGSPDPGGLFFHDVQVPVPCADKMEVAVALSMITGHGKAAKMEIDWALFEMVDGRYERRAITFKRDGRTVEKIG